MFVRNKAVIQFENRTKLHQICRSSSWTKPGHHGLLKSGTFIEWRDSIADHLIKVLDENSWGLMCFSKSCVLRPETHISQETCLFDLLFSYITITMILSCYQTLWIKSFSSTLLVTRQKGLNDENVVENSSNKVTRVVSYKKKDNEGCSMYDNICIKQKGDGDV